MKFRHLNEEWQSDLKVKLFDDRHSNVKHQNDVNMKHNLLKHQSV